MVKIVKFNCSKCGTEENVEVLENKCPAFNRCKECGELVQPTGKCE